ncbi:MAG: TerC family protein [Phycisphaerales bacterium]
MDAITALLTVENLIALLTLTALEVVLGIDNVVFLAILSGKLPPEDQRRARRTGLLAAMVMRIALLLCVGWIANLTTPWLTIDLGELHIEISGRNLILLVGGLVLIAKSVREIHHKIDAHDATDGSSAKAISFAAVIAQIMVMDLVFSIDSVITAVGMAQSVVVMIVAVVLSVAIMMVFAEPISRFVDERPSLKILALAFLIMIGAMLVADGLGHHFPKGYIYFAMAFALGVEMLNFQAEKAAARRARAAERIPGK